MKVPVHFVPPFDRGPVFLGGTFNDWNDSHPEFELTDPDDDGEWSAIVTIDPGIHHFRYHQANSQWLRDPDVLEVDAPWGNSEFNVSDPMIVYLLPLDGGIGLRPREPIRAAFGFGASNPIEPESLEVLVNGVPLENPESYYDVATQEFWYVPLALMEPGQFTVQVSASSPLGSVVRSTTFNRAPAVELLTEDITYRRADIVAYGQFNDPELVNIKATLNGVVVDFQIEGDLFTAPIHLQNGDNIFEVEATDSFGNLVASSQILHAEFDLRPRVEIQASVVGDTVDLMAIGQAHDDGALTYKWFADSENPDLIAFELLEGEISSFLIPILDGEYYFNVIATDASRNSHTARRLLTVEGGSAHLNRINDHSQWIDDMILYELMPQVSAPYGNMSDAINRLPAVADLGVNTIWMTPIFATGHDCTLGYDTTDYYDICVASGDIIDDFREFVDTAHSFGLRVILDFALSHTSYRHPFMQNILELKQDSPFADFYIWDGVPGDSDYAHEPPQWARPFLNYSNPEVVDYIIDVAEYWLEEFNLDGYRMDVASKVQERSPAFWPEFRRRLKNIRPESYLLSEGVPPTVELYQERFDSNFDFDLRGWGYEDQNSLIKLLDGTGTIDNVHSVITRAWPAHAQPVRFVEQHDHPRVPRLYDVERSKLVHTLISTVPGIPMFFAGGEVGHNAGQWDFDSPVDWEDSLGVRPFFKKLIDIRNGLIRADGVLTRLSNTSPSEIYSYRTSSAKGEVTTLLNFADSSVQGTFDAGEIGPPEANFHQITDLLSDTKTTIDKNSLGMIDFDLAAHGVAILTIKPATISFEINSGHAGAWFNPDTSGQGQLIDVEPESKFLFLSWFTFTHATSANPNEQHWFTAQGNYSGNTADLIVSETLGGRFDDPQVVSTEPVGTATLSFGDCGIGRLDYSIDSWDLRGSFPLRRAIPGTENVCEERAGNTSESLDLNDGWDAAWFDEETPGQGFLIDVRPNAEGDDFIFVAWFTYGENTASGQRWLTAQGPFEGSIADLVVYETTGGSFDDPKPSETNAIGSMTIDFTDCSNAQLTYSITDEALAGIIDIKRAIPGTEALCQELTGSE